MNYETIDLQALKRLRRYELPRTYHLQKDPGNGCYLDPPGYPTYFTRSIYTPVGNSPSRGVETVIEYDGTLYVVAHSDDWNNASSRFDPRLWKPLPLSHPCEKRLRRLWKPLPLSHPRTVAWMRKVYRHLGRCYVDAERPEYGKPGTLISPVPGYKLRKFRDDKRWSEEYRRAARAEVEAFNKQELERAATIATPENHQAVRLIQRFYPDHKPDLALIAEPPKQVGGNWWQTEAERPTPETCKPRSMGPHPISGTWCQWCGWRKEAA